MLKILRFIPIQLTFCLVLGILTGYYLYLTPKVLIIIISALFIVLYLFYYQSLKRIKPTFQFQLVTLLLSFFIGMGSMVFKSQLNRTHHYVNFVEFSEDQPELSTISISKVLKPSNYYDKYEVQVEQIGNKPVIGKVLLNVERDTLRPLFKVDDRFVFNGVFKQIHKPLNPYGFNYKNYLRNQQIYHQITISKHQLLRFLETRVSIQGIAAGIRERINNTLMENGFKNDELALINALLLGQRNGISNDLRQSYVRAGAIHILAISGLHIGILLMLLMFVFKPLHQFRHGKFIALFFIIVFLWLYAILAGLSASVVRAATMFTAVALGLSFNRPTNVYNTLVTSIFFLLLIHPYYLFDVGFQLSYIAVFSIVWLQPKIAALFMPNYWLTNKIWQLFTVSIAAQIGVLPLSLYYFHQFPGLFFLSNLIIIPFLGIILIGGFALIFFSLIDMLPELYGRSYRFIIIEMNQFVSWISRQEFFLIEHISYSYLLMLATYCFIISCVIWTEKRNFFRLVPVLICIMALQGIFIWEKQQLLSKKEFIVFNKSRESLTGIRKRSELVIRTSLPSVIRKEPSLNSYMVHEGITSLQVEVDRASSIYKFNGESILIVDSLAFYKTSAFRPSIVILQNSPKINLDRLMELHHPKLIIADGSNYKSYVEKWEETCLKKKTPFHSTMQKGAFILREQ